MDFVIPKGDVKQRSVFVTQCSHIQKLTDPGRELDKAFSVFGNVVSAKLYGPPMGPYKGAGEVVFSSKEEAEAAVVAKRVECYGANVLIKEFKDRTDMTPTNRKRPHPSSSPKTEQPFESYERRKERERDRDRDREREFRESPPNKVTTAAAASASPVATQHYFAVDDTKQEWTYVDPTGNTQGPFTLAKLRKWSDRFPTGLIVQNNVIPMLCPLSVALTFQVTEKNVRDLLMHAIKDVAMAALADSPANFEVCTLVAESVAKNILAHNAEGDVQQFMTPLMRAKIALAAHEQIERLL